jgi:hypothetical protein
MQPGSAPSATGASAAQSRLRHAAGYLKLAGLVFLLGWCLILYADDLDERPVGSAALASLLALTALSHHLASFYVRSRRARLALNALAIVALALCVWVRLQLSPQS